jgi:hypothetical protein
VTTNISGDPPGIVAGNSAARTDGVVITYVKPFASGDLLVVDTAGSKVTVAPGMDLKLAGGWIVRDWYTAEMATDVFRYGSFGDERLTDGSGMAGPDAIGTDGTVLLHTDWTTEYLSYFQRSKARRGRAVPGAALEQVGSGLGKVVYRDGKFLVLIGASVLEVLP